MSDFPYLSMAVGATEKTLDDWGLTNPIFSLRSRAVSTFVLTKYGGDPAAVPDIAFEAQVTIYAQLAGLNGGAKTAIFKGRRTDINGRGDGSGRDVILVFSDAWYDLLHTVFQHYWKMGDGSGGVTNVYFSRLNLFQDISAGPGTDWTYLNAQAQLQEIIAYASGIAGILIQAGTIDPVWNMPVTAVKAITCAEAIMEVLRPMPDTVTFFDYATTPPTLHIRQRANCTALTLPWAKTDANGTTHTSINIKPRPDLQIPQVVVQYQKINNVDGNSFQQTVLDAYPPGSNGVGLRALPVPIDLRGGTVTHIKEDIISQTVDPTASAFWKEHDPTLNDANIIFDPTTPIVDTTINAMSGHPDGITIRDESGLYVDLTDFPNKLIDGTPADWMTTGDDIVEGVKVTITATLKYSKKIPTASGTLIVHKMEKHVVDARITLTNSPAGTEHYSTISGSEAGDPAILGLAYSIWCAANNVPVHYVGSVATPPATVPPITTSSNLQWEGSHNATAQKVFQIIGPGNALNLDGPGVNTDWQNMGAAIYETEIDFFHGKTTINFGPHQHLTAQQFYEVLTTFSTRHVFENPALRNTGTAGTSGGTQIGGASARENTNKQTPSQPLHSAHAPDAGDATKTVVVQQDAASNGGQFVIQTYKSDATVDTAKPKLNLANNDIGTVNDAGVTGRESKHRLWYGCNDAGEEISSYIVSTEPE